MTAHTQLWVYNSENCFVGLFYQFTCRVKRTKGLNDKPEFWDRLVVTTKNIAPLGMMLEPMTPYSLVKISF